MKEKIYNRLKKSWLVLFLALPLFAGQTLQQDILELEGKRKDRMDYRELGALYVLNNQYSKAATTFNALYRLDKRGEFLFNQAMAEQASDQNDLAIGSWQQYFKMGASQRGGMIWDDWAKTLQSIAYMEEIPDEEAFIGMIREAYLGKGYYTAWLLIDIYLKNGGKQHAFYMREIRIEMYYRMNYLDEAYEGFSRLLGMSGDDYFLYKLAKISYKQGDFDRAREELDRIASPSLKSFRYYYLQAKVSSRLQDSQRLNSEIQQAEQLARYSDESKLIDKLKIENGLGYVEERK